MSEFTWSDDSALWQVMHGERGTKRTENAGRYLKLRLHGNTGTVANAIVRSEFSDDTGDDTDGNDTFDETWDAMLSGWDRVRDSLPTEAERELARAVWDEFLADELTEGQQATARDLARAILSVRDQHGS